MKYLTEEQLQELAQFDTPTVSNALEKFGINTRVEGFTNPEIRSIFGKSTPVVGYACTAKVSAAAPGPANSEEILFQYYQSIKDCPIHPISVIEDIDPTPVGSFWGEVQTTVHKALGCMSVITTGGVRDLKEAEALSFTYIAKSVLVSHGYIHVEEAGIPVSIAGLTVNPGDLLHGDQHGVIAIPHEVAHLVADACRQMQEAELPVLNGCRGVKDGELSLDDLRVWRKEMAELRNKK